MTKLTESAPLVQAAAGGVATKFRARLIEGNVQGSSGFYSQEVLESAATRGVFHTGLPMFIDHPDAEERKNRPERSIRDLAGVLASDAIYESDGLYADVMLYSHIAPVISEMKDHIGLSIRAAGEVAETATGRVVTEISEAASVDYVTAAGAGGKLVSLLESAQSSLSETLADDRRDQLSQVIPAHAYVRDFDDDQHTVYYIAWDEEDDANRGIFSQPYTVADDGQSVTLTGSPVEVRVVTTYVPVSSAGQIPTTESTRGLIMAEIEEARLRELEEAAGRVSALEAERDAERKRAEDAEKVTKDRDLREAATTQAREAVKDLPPQMADRIVTEAVRDIPTKDDALDAPALTEALNTAIAAEKAYAEALNPRTLAGFGASTPADTINEASPVSPWGRKTTKEA